MKQKLAWLVVSLFILSATVTAAWASPVGARIYFTKATDLKVPATYTFRFSIWDVATGGTNADNRVWWEEKEVAMTETTLSTYLGDVADPTMRSGPLGDVDFSEQYWVMVEKLAADGVTFKVVGGRTRLTVVPYAMWSETAGAGGSVRSVTAGSGLTGTDADGDITLNIGAGPGISVGANKISIATEAVSSSMLKAGAVTSDKIAAGAVVNAKLVDGAVSNAKLVDGAVGNTKLADGAVGNAKLVDGAVSNAKLADGAVSNAKLVDGAVGNTKLADGAVSNAKLVDGAVTSGKITSGAVGNVQLADGAVTFTKIGTTCPNGYHPTYSTGAGWICGAGTPGADGRTILNGSDDPTNSVGMDGDFYINTTISTLFGPKSEGVWPAGVRISVPVTSSASCSSASSMNNGDCKCSRIEISKEITYNSCTATSDTGSCTATGLQANARFGSCCVCAY